MRNLRSQRTTQIKPCSIVGSDYAALVSVAQCKRRGIKSLKVYISIFVCFRNNVIHLEFSADLSSETFLCCLKRLIARRERCSQLFSDHFIGESRILIFFMISTAENETISWSFNPSSVPHFGRLW